MFRPLNYRWKCKRCGEEILGHEDEKLHQPGRAQPKCQKCGGEMEGSPIIHGGPPHREDPFKKY